MSTHTEHEIATASRPEQPRDAQAWYEVIRDVGTFAEQARLAGQLAAKDAELARLLAELERRRDAANDPRKALEVAVERIGDICQLYRMDDDLLKRELGERLEKDLAEMQRVLAETAPPTP